MLCPTRVDTACHRSGVNFAGSAPPDLLALVRDRLPWPRLIAGGAALLALLVAAAEVGNWSVFLRFVYQVPYDAGDPLYNNYTGFYLFSLPAYILIKNWTMLALVLNSLGTCSRDRHAQGP